MADQADRDPKVEDIRRRLGDVATQLCTRIDPVDVAATYLTTGMVILARQIGKEAAGEYMRAMAAELEADDDQCWGGRA